MSHTTQKHHAKHHPRLKKRHFVASGSLITLGSGLLSFSLLSFLVA